MSLGLKIFKVIGEGVIAGDVIDSDNNTIFLKFPGKLQGFQTPQGMDLSFIDIVPTFFKNFRELVEKYPLKRIHISMMGDIDPKLISYYGVYTEDLIERLTGIKMANKSDLDKLPIDQKSGQPIIK